MKKLSIFFIKSFVGPFLATFFISMFMLVMQFLWKYIDDLMGKGLETAIIIELLFYVSASLLPLALPLAILLSSLIVMGNLGESNELTALKSSGLSIYRILRPLTSVVVLIAIGTFYFSNYVIPVANYKWHSIIWDIQEKKMTSFLKPGSYTQEIDGFSIKIKDGKDNSFEDIIIHDRRNSREIKTITAKSGTFYQSENGDFLFFKLFDGNVIEELAQSPDFQMDNSSNKNHSIFPSRKSDFKTATYKMDMTGFKLQRSKDELFKNDYEMLNVFQIDETADSIKIRYNELMESLSFNSKAKHAYFQSIHFLNDQKMDTVQKSHIDNYIAVRNKIKRISNDTNMIDIDNGSSTEDVKSTKNSIQDSIPQKIKIQPIYAFKNMPDSLQTPAINHMKSQLRNNIKSLEGQIDIEGNRHRVMRRYEIEFHRKFALSFSIIILFFIGAPLGAIVKRGGFGAPVVIAALLFMIYFVLITIGDGMAESQVLSPFFGMWGPNILLTPIAALLMISAANDRSVVVIPKWMKRKKNG